MAADGRTLVTANKFSNNIAICDLQTQQLRCFVPAGDGPRGVGVTSDGKYAVVANEASNDVSVIDMLAGQKVAQVGTLGYFPHQVVISKDNSFAFVMTIGTSLVSGNVSVIGLNAGASGLVKTLPVGTIRLMDLWVPYCAVSRMALSPSGGMLGVCVNADDAFVLLDTVKMLKVASVKVGATPMCAVFTPDGARAYVTNMGSNDVSVIDIQGGGSKEVARVKGIGSPLGIVLDASGSFAYVAGYLTPAIYAVSTATNQVVKTLPLPLSPREVTFSAKTGMVYVACGPSVDAIIHGTSPFLGQLIAIRASGAQSAISSTTALFSSPSDAVLSDSLGTCVVSLPATDGLDLVPF